MTVFWTSSYFVSYIGILMSRVCGKVDFLNLVCRLFNSKTSNGSNSRDKVCLEIFLSVLFFLGKSVLLYVRSIFLLPVDKKLRLLLTFFANRSARMTGGRFWNWKNSIITIKKTANEVEKYSWKTDFLNWKVGFLLKKKLISFWTCKGWQRSSNDIFSWKRFFRLRCEVSLQKIRKFLNLKKIKIWWRKEYFLKEKRFHDFKRHH